jgi:hypothetical protein
LKSNKVDLEKALKKNVWMSIAKMCAEEFGKPVTHQQCDAKWKSLKRTYKSILLNNKTTGKGRRNWEFFTAIHSFMFTKPEITPTATCTSRSGLQCNETKETTGKLNGNQNRKCEELEVKTPESSFSQKRKARVASAHVRYNCLLCLFRVMT